jgi:large subunit ribosomal protein L29
MASKSWRELSECSPEELMVKERELAESLFRLRLRHRTNQLDNPAALGKTRRDIARVKTLLRAATMKAKA